MNHFEDIGPNVDFGAKKGKFGLNKTMYDWFPGKGKTEKC